VFGDRKQGGRQQEANEQIMAFNGSKKYSLLEGDMPDIAGLMLSVVTTRLPRTVGLTTGTRPHLGAFYSIWHRKSAAEEVIFAS
jgi:hypothetical protein